MKTKNLTIAEAIQKVEEGFGSVYTKEDVINLLNSIKEEDGDESTPIHLFIDGLEKIKGKIIDRIMENMESSVIDYDSASLSIGYNNQVEIDDISLDDSQVERVIGSAINQVIADLQADAEETESENK